MIRVVFLWLAEWGQVYIAFFFPSKSKNLIVQSLSWWNVTQHWSRNCITLLLKHWKKTNKNHLTVKSVLNDGSEYCYKSSCWCPSGFCRSSMWRNWLLASLPTFFKDIFRGNQSVSGKNSCDITVFIAWSTWLRLALKQAEKDGVVQPGEDEAWGRSYCGLSTNPGCLQERWRQSSKQGLLQ